jgi:molecular chaperone GrpE
MIIRPDQKKDLNQALTPADRDAESPAGRPSALPAERPPQTDPVAPAAEKSVGTPPETLTPEEEAMRYKDLALRAQAELENAKKRLEREKRDIIKFANENLIKGLLPIVDNLERALDHTEPDQAATAASLTKGVQLILGSLRSLLEKNGVNPVTAVGEKFDPNFHEAVMQEENPEVDEGTVTREVQRGYLLRDRLIRPAMVVVSRRPASAESNGQTA